MSEVFFFALGLVNSLFLILLFIVRKTRMSLVKRFGWTYFLTAIPAIFGMFLVYREQATARYIIFLGIFLAFLLAEWLYDYVLKVDFRVNWKKNWKWLVPYLFLYYAMNYGFVVMPWKTSTAWGMVMLGLFIVQLIANLAGHPRVRQ